MVDDGHELSEILRRRREKEAQARRGRTLPKGTEPRVELDPSTGQGVVAGNFKVGVTRDWSAVLAFAGYDPDEFEVDDDYPVEVRAWDGIIGAGDVQRMHYVKAKLRLASTKVDADELVAYLARRRPPRLKPAKVDTGITDVLCPSDWQIGKAHEEGGGTPQTIDRAIDMIGRAQDRFRDRRKVGAGAYRLVLAGMGDLREACAGHYPSQTFTTDLNEREQARVCRWLLTKVVSELAPLYSEVVMASVASNHGQNRLNGRAYTTHDDDADLSTFEAVAEALAQNPDNFGHVAFHESADPLVVTLDVSGTGVAFIHAHQVKGVAKPIYSIWDWWDNQMAGRLPAGDCRVLVSAHYHHHFRLGQQGRTLLACPALDGGSRWLTDRTGIWSDPGTLVFSMHEGDALPQGVTLL